MYVKIICIVVILLLLSSCVRQNDNDVFQSEVYENSETESVTETIVEYSRGDEQSPDKTETEPLPESNTTTETAFKPFPAIVIDDDEIPFLAIKRPFNDGPCPRADVIDMLFYIIPHYEFYKLLNEDEYNIWMTFIENNDHARHPIEGYINVISLNEFSNLHALFNMLDFSEQRIKESLIYWNEFIPIISEKREFSEEEINIFASKNTTEILKYFCLDFFIIKDCKFYSPGWFFFSNIDDYKNANITIDDIIFILSKERNRIDWQDNFFNDRFFVDLIEYKTYNYLNGNVDIIELSGYDRDFSMPMAYNGYYWYILNDNNGYQRYYVFFNSLNADSVDGFNIIKNEHTYSPHWVYYNKPEAYIEAGIAPDELIEMLPRYENLGILSEAAWEALQEKIYRYAELQ